MDKDLSTTITDICFSGAERGLGALVVAYVGSALHTIVEEALETPVQELAATKRKVCAAMLNFVQGNEQKCRLNIYYNDDKENTSDAVAVHYRSYFFTGRGFWSAHAVAIRFPRVQAIYLSLEDGQLCFMTASNLAKFIEVLGQRIGYVHISAPHCFEIASEVDNSFAHIVDSQQKDGVIILDSYSAGTDRVFCNSGRGTRLFVRFFRAK